MITDNNKSKYKLIIFISTISGHNESLFSATMVKHFFQNEVYHYY